MMLFYNHNDLYGDCGPHEADSKEDLADKMHELFMAWSGDHSEKNNCSISNAVQQMRNEFIESLEEMLECYSCGENSLESDLVDGFCKNCEEEQDESM